jgi:site-specific recombinase XerD
MSNNIASPFASPSSSLSLPDLIAYYETCNRAEGKSPKTIKWYSDNLKRFHNYLKSRHLPDSLDRIDIRLLREYTLHLLKQCRFASHPFTPVQTNPLSSSTVHGHVRTLRAFFSWLVREGLAEINIARDLKPPKVARKIVTTLSDEEIQAILRTFHPSNPSDARNQTIFMLLLDTGMRIGELINAKTEDAHMNEGFIKVKGKGNRERMVPIGSSGQRILQRYLFRYRPKPANANVDNVFLTSEGYPLSENSVKLTFARLANKAQRGDHVSQMARRPWSTEIPF